MEIMNDNDKTSNNKKPHDVVIMESRSVCDFLMDKAILKLRKEEYIDAISLLYRVIQLDDGYKAPRRLLIDALMEISCYDQALWILSETMHKFGEEDADVMIQLGNYYLETGHYNAAYDVCSIISRKIDSESDDEIIESLVEAMDYCESMMDDGEDEDDGYDDENEYSIRDVADIEYDEFLSSIETLFKDEEYAKIIEKLEPYIYRNPRQTMLLNVLLMSYYCDREFERAAKLLKSLPKKMDYSVQMHCISAMIYKRAGMIDDAELECNEVLNQAPDSSDTALKVCAMLYEMDKGNEQILKYAKICYNMRPYDKEIMHIYARSLAIGGDTANAAKLYSRILRIYPGDFIAKYYRDLCMSDETIRPETIPVAYTLQAGAIMDCCAKCMAKISNKFVLTAAERQEVEELTKWALGAQNYGIVITLISFMHTFKHQMKPLGHYIMKHAEIPQMIKLLAMEEIGFTNDSDSGYGYSEGEFVFIKLEKKYPQLLGNMVLPAAYKAISNIVNKGVSEQDGAAWCEGAVTVRDEFIMGGINERIQFTKLQIEAIGAAILYLAPFVDDDTLEAYTDEAHKAFLARNNLSQVRFRNAVKIVVKYSPSAAKAVNRLGMKL